jgi:ABC-2 type transport system ATP-binding protein
LISRTKTYRETVSGQAERRPSNESYKNVRVLEAVDFEVKTGSIFALLGSNGAGKTTIVKILTTLLKQVCGTAIVIGFDVTSNPESQTVN